MSDVASTNCVNSSTTFTRNKYFSTTNNDNKISYFFFSTRILLGLEKKSELCFQVGLVVGADGCSTSLHYVLESALRQNLFASLVPGRNVVVSVNIEFECLKKSIV